MSRAVSGRRSAIRKATRLSWRISFSVSWDTGPILSAVTSSPRIVAHLDLDAFFAAVEELEQPALSTRPLVVGGDPQGRDEAVVLARGGHVQGGRQGSERPAEARWHHGRPAGARGRLPSPVSCSPPARRGPARRGSPAGGRNRGHRRSGGARGRRAEGG